MLSDDTISLRHIPRRSSKNCDPQFANNDRFKANYSIDSHLDMHRSMYVTMNDNSSNKLSKFSGLNMKYTIDS